jgi:shikimate kinase
MKTSIALIGFMGTGKSAISKMLADRLGKILVEADSLIAEKAGKSIPEIFEEDGEIAFRELEINVIKQIASGNNQVIDCGGGVVLNRINIDRIKQNAVVVWLIASPEVVIKRTNRNQYKRPLLRGKTDVGLIKQMICSREFYYQSAADVKIDTSDLDIATLTERIIQKVQEYADICPAK